MLVCLANHEQAKEKKKIRLGMERAEIDLKEKAEEDETKGLNKSQTTENLRAATG